ncbi:MAG: extracellular solute-binding protein [Proteobacteria bacterium]|nr:extracellular solute-binding protein [Pseudomonadota bacterium]
MREKLDLNVLLPAGMTRRQTMKALAASLGMSALPGSAFAQERTLNYFTWSSWGEKPFADLAKAKVNIEFRPTFFSSSDEMVAKLRGGGTKLYDMVVPAQHFVALSVRAGLFEPLDPAKMTHRDDLFPEFQNDPNWTVDGKLYGVPFVWGANAMAFNRKLTGEIDSMKALFDPKWKGRIALRDDAEDTLCMGALMLGIKDPTNMDEKALQEVKKLLISQKPLLRAYWKNVADLQTMLASGEVVVAWSFLNVIDPLKKAGIDAGWVWPKEGALGWSEAVSAVKGTKKLALVEEFANFTLSPEYGEVMARYNSYAPASKVAVDRLEPKLAADLGIDPKAFGRLTFKGNLANRSRWNDIWNEVKAA